MTAATMTEAWADLIDNLPEGGARGVRESITNKALLERCMQLGWSPEQVAIEAANNLGPAVDDPAAVVASWLRRIADSNVGPRSSIPAPQSYGDDTTRWTQPYPACGNCSGGNGRWTEVIEYGEPTGKVRRCDCWTKPPKWRNPIQTCPGCRRRTAVKTTTGEPECPACGGGAPRNLLEPR